MKRLYTACLLFFLSTHPHNEDIFDKVPEVKTSTYFKAGGAFTLIAGLTYTFIGNNLYKRADLANLLQQMAISFGGGYVATKIGRSIYEDQPEVKYRHAIEIIQAMREDPLFQDALNNSEPFDQVIKEKFGSVENPEWLAYSYLTYHDSYLIYTQKLWVGALSDPNLKQDAEECINHTIKYRMQIEQRMHELISNQKT